LLRMRMVGIISAACKRREQQCVSNPLLPTTSSSRRSRNTTRCGVMDWSALFSASLCFATMSSGDDTCRSPCTQEMYAQYPNPRSYLPQQQQQQQQQQQFVYAPGQQVIYARQPRIPAQFHQVCLRKSFRVVCIPSVVGVHVMDVLALQVSPLSTQQAQSAPAAKNLGQQVRPGYFCCLASCILFYLEEVSVRVRSISGVLRLLCLSTLISAISPHSGAPPLHPHKG